MIDREALVQRQEGECWWCGCHLGSNFAVHHRKLRKHGGSDCPSNLLALHHECHNLGTHSVHLAPWDGYDRGFLVPSWCDPQETPLTDPSGAHMTVHPDGTVTKERDNVW